MSRDPSRSLSDTFAALAQAPSRRLGPWPYLPFVVTILVAALLAALIAAMVIEDRQLQREALQRDVDSTAQQLSARLLLVREALSVVAVEMSTGTVDTRRFAALAAEMIDSKPELIALAHLDGHGRALSPPVLNSSFGPGWDPAAMRFNSLAFRLIVTSAAWLAVVLPIAGYIIFRLYSEMFRPASNSGLRSWSIRSPSTRF